MESEIIPMCEDQGMAIVSWASLGGGHLLTKEQRQEKGKDPRAPKDVYYICTEDDIKVCNILEHLATVREASLQDVALTYLFH
ncbi:hypothetical protein N0V90_005670 [Kalmusia sp. IMI 367209]|nr:hypothetical protein N0V90_005670 [Kalmusia sp. IMI 367209]